MGARSGSNGLSSIVPRFKPTTGPYTSAYTFAALVSDNPAIPFAGNTRTGDICKHAINVPVQCARTGLIISGKRKAKINPLLYQFFYDGIIALIAACPIPTKRDHPFEISFV